MVYTLFSCLLNPLYSSVVTFRVVLVAVLFLSYLLLILSLLWEGGSRVDLTKKRLIIYDFRMSRYFNLAAILMLENVASLIENNINTL